MWVEKHGNRFRVLDRDRGRKYTVRSFETEAEALMFAGAQRSPAEGFSFIPMPKIASVTRRTTPTVAAYGQLLIDNPELRPSSRHIYEKALRKIEDSLLGGMELHEVGPVDIRQFDNMLKTDRSNTILFVRKLFRAARREGTIRSDPAEQANLKRPKAMQKKLKPLTLAEVDQLAAATLNDQEALWVRIGAYAGLRGGETGGLRLEDIDFKRCRIDIVQNSNTVGSKRGLGEPKTGSSARNIPVPCSLVEAIADYVRARPPGLDGLLFRTSQGGLVTAYQVSRAVRRAAKRAGMRPVSSHDLRHACAANLIRQGQSPKAIQLYLGHSDIRTTMNIYGRLFEGDDDALARGMEAAIQVARKGNAA
ncbi:MAG: site-specific integrase [Actinomycetota bacterium]|nr:site-specific integrase [Actinomycetota bacterium]